MFLAGTRGAWYDGRTRLDENHDCRTITVFYIQRAAPGVAQAYFERHVLSSWCLSSPKERRGARERTCHREERDVACGGKAADWK